MTNKENTRKIIRFMAGGYLSYLAFQLYSDVFHEILDTTFRVIFFLFATLFLVVGFILMFSVLWSEFKKIKNQNTKEPDALEEHIEADTETTDTTDNEE